MTETEQSTSYQIVLNFKVEDVTGNYGLTTYKIKFYADPYNCLVLFYTENNNGEIFQSGGTPPAGFIELHIIEAIKCHKFNISKRVNN